MSRATFVVVGLLSCAVAAAASAQQPRADVASRVRSAWQVPVDSAASYEVWLEGSAPTRVRLTLDGPEGEHIAVEFDPVQGGKMARTVTLAKGSWRASLWAEPLLVSPASAQKDPRFVMARFVDATDETLPEDVVRKAKGSAEAHAKGGGREAPKRPARQYVFRGELFDVFGATGTPPEGAKDQNAAPTAPRLGLEFAVHMEEKSNASPSALRVVAPAELAVRGLDQQISPAASELFQILAEIALDRARSRGFAVLSSQLADWVCEDLTWGRVTRQGLDALALGRPPPEAGPKDGTPGTAPTDPGAPENEVASLDGARGGKALLIPAVVIGGTVEGGAQQVSRVPAPIAAPRTTQGRVLSNTCEVVRGLRIEEIATSGRIFQRALSADVAAFGPTIARQVFANVRLPVGHKAAILDYPGLVARAAPYLARAASRGLGARDAQLLLLELADWAKAQAEAKAEAKGGPEVRERAALLATTLQAVFLTAAECQARAGCGPDDVVAVLRAHTGDLEALRRSLSAIDVAWGDPDLLAARVLDIASPPRGATPTSTAHAVFDLVFDVAERARTVECSEFGCDRDAAMLALHDLRLIARGLVDGDAQPVVVSAAGILQRLAEEQRELCDKAKDVVSYAEATRKQPQREPGASIRSEAGLQGGSAVATPLAGAPPPTKEEEQEAVKRLASLRCSVPYMPTATRALRVVSAVASYAAVPLDPSGDPKKVEAERAARKKTIESLIDAMTDREGRVATWVASIGANVGFGLAALENDASGRFAKSGTYGPSLQLPLGLAFQRLPRERMKGESFLSNPGVHLQLSAVDLGRFIPAAGASAEPTWEDVVYVGAEAGLIFGSGKNPFVLGIEVSARPVFAARNADNEWPVRTGVFLAYFVPFLDLN